MGDYLHENGTAVIGAMNWWAPSPPVRCRGSLRPGWALRGRDGLLLATHGRLDKLIEVSTGQHTAAIMPGARLSIYDRVGPASFWDDAPRFNRKLAELARSSRR